MQSVEEKKAYYNVIIKTCYTTNIIYLSLHLVYFVLFLIAKEYTIFYINLGSILIYSLTFIMLKHKKYYPYALVCGNEFLVFMSVLTILCGFYSGFHLCIIGLSVVSFFSVYFSKVNRDVSKAITWCILSLAIYLFIFLYTYYNEPVYVLDRWLNVILIIIHSIAVFVFIAAYLITFMNYAMKLEKKVINESRTDNLTQLHNRYDLYNYLDSLEDKDDYSLAMFDIDDFKLINDKYGHLCGDEILRELAQIVNENLPNSFVSRYGGEEFIIITKIDGDIEKPFNEVENVRKIVEKHEFRYGEEIIHLTITIGIEKYNNNITNEKWIELADNKLYSGKKLGKNRTIV